LWVLSPIWISFLLFALILAIAGIIIAVCK
jgi:hypothetical protein